MIKKIINRAFYFDIDCYFLFSFSGLTGVVNYYNDRYEIAVVNSDSSLFPRLMDFYLLERWNKDKESLENHLKDKMTKGQYCVVSLTNGMVVGASWCCRLPNKYISDFASCVNKDAGSYLCFDSYVSSSHRGNKLQQRMDEVRKKLAFEDGANRVYTFVGCRNFSSVRNMLSVNDKYKIVYHIMFKLGRNFCINFYPKWCREPWREINI